MKNSNPFIILNQPLNVENNRQPTITIDSVSGLVSIYPNPQHQHQHQSSLKSTGKRVYKKPNNYKRRKLTQTSMLETIKVENDKQINTRKQKNKKHILNQMNSHNTPLNVNNNINNNNNSDLYCDGFDDNQPHQKLKRKSVCKRSPFSMYGSSTNQRRNLSQMPILERVKPENKEKEKQNDNDNDAVISSIPAEMPMVVKSGDRSDRGGGRGRGIAKVDVRAACVPDNYAQQPMNNNNNNNKNNCDTDFSDSNGLYFQCATEDLQRQCVQLYMASNHILTFDEKQSDEKQSIANEKSTRKRVNNYNSMLLSGVIKNTQSIATNQVDANFNGNNSLPQWDSLSFETKGQLNKIWIDQEQWGILCDKTRMLTDHHIEAAHKLLQQQFHGTDGCQDVLSGQAKKFKRIEYEGVQILHLHAHWITSTKKWNSDQVLLIDSLRNSAWSLSDEIKIAIAQLYAKPESMDRYHIEYKFIAMQQQTGGLECGLFSIATAIDSLLGNDVSKIHYDQSMMRSHYIECLINNKLTPFPRKSGSNVKRNYEENGRIRLICHCGLPKCARVGTTIKCRICNNEFHESHIVSNAVNKRNWICSNCAQSKSQ